MTLDELNTGQAATVLAIDGEGPLGQRLMELGLLEGSDISVTRRALGGDPIEVQVMGYALSLRPEEARRRRVPAFRIRADRTLAVICRARPVDDEELLDVAGIGPTTVRKHGRKILAAVAAESNRDNETE